MSDSFNADAWQSADPDAPMENNDPPDPGVYEAMLADAKAFTSSKGNDVAIVEWKIVSGGQMAGYQYPAIYTFKNEGAIKAAKATAARIGVDVDKIGGLDDLDVALKQHIGDYYGIEVVQNGQWRNTYVQGRAQAPLSDVPNDGFDPAPTDAATDDQTIPF